MEHFEILINNHYKGFNPTQYGYQKCRPRHSFGPAVRPYWLLHYVISGKGVFRLNGNEYHVFPGEIFVIPPFIESYYEADADSPWYYTWIGFESDIDLPDDFGNPIIRCHPAGKIFESMRECSNMQNGKSAFLSAKIWELLSAVLEVKKIEYDYVDFALNCMSSEYMNGITVEDIAKRLNINRCYFSSVFSKKIGLPPSQYLLNLRLEKAADLMTNHSHSPSLAAASVGYSDIYNFSKIFKKKYGVSPRQYKKSTGA